MENWSTVGERRSTRVVVVGVVKVQVPVITGGRIVGSAAPAPPLPLGSGLMVWRGAMGGGVCVTSMGWSERSAR